MKLYHILGSHEYFSLLLVIFIAQYGINVRRDVKINSLFVIHLRFLYRKYQRLNQL